MACSSASLTLLLSVTAIVADAIQASETKANANKLHGLVTRQTSPVNNPGESRFLRRVGGAGRSCQSFFSPDRSVC
jgi:hypothetical protein